MTTPFTTQFPLHQRFWKTHRHLRRLGGRLTGRSIVFIGLSICTIAATAATLWTAGLAMHAVQLAHIERTMSLLFWVGGYFIGACAFALAQQTVLRAMRAKWTCRARNTLLTQVLQLSHQNATQLGANNLAQPLSFDVEEAAKLVIELPAEIMANSIQLATWITIIALINWRLSALVAILTVALLIPRKFISLARQRATVSRDKAAATLQLIETQSLKNFRDICSLGAENGIVRLHLAASLELQKKNQRAKMWQFTQQYAVLALCGCAGLVILGFGLHSVRAGYLNTYELTIFSLFLVSFYWPLRFFAQLPKLVESHLSSCDRLAALLSVPNRSNNVMNRPLAVRTGTVTFENVHFAGTDETPLLRDLSLTVAGGQTIALVGPTGSGKSTLARLLLRLDDADSGRIMLDDIDIQTVNLESLRFSVGVVWERPVIFPGTLRENLLLAAPGASDEELFDACRAAHATDIIARLPDGVNTLLTNETPTLTQGEIQRLSLTQLFLRNPAVVFVYEPPATQEIEGNTYTEALEKLRMNRTCFIDAHRLHTIKSADNVLYFHGDGTTTLGRHQDLMEHHATYRSAIQWQTRRVSVS